MSNPDSTPTRAVFFDLAGTLITVRGGIGAQYAAIAREYGVAADAAAIDAAFPRAFRSAGRMVFARPDAAEVASLEKGFWKEVVRQVFAGTGTLAQFADGQFDRYFDRLFDYFATAAGWTIYPDVVPVLAEMQGRGYLLGLITNFDYRVFRLVEALGLSRFLDSITIPALAGAAKPEPPIFQYALARHGLRANDAVQVGDSLRDDVEGARAAGLRGVLVDRRPATNDHRAGDRRPTTNDLRPTTSGRQPTTITSLEELRPLLGIPR